MGFAPMAALRGAVEWCWLLALLGYALRFWNRPVAYLAAFTRYAYPFYIFHQTVIVVLAYFVLRKGLGTPAEYAIIAMLATTVSYGLARLFDTNPVTRFLIGLPAGLPARRTVAT